MGKVVRILLFEKDGDTVAAHEKTIKDLQITDEKAALGDKARWLEMTFRDPTFRLDKAIVRAAQELRDGVWVLKQEELPQKRFAAVVEGWNRPEPPTEEAFLDLSPVVATAIDESLLRHMYPNVMANDDFFKCWSLQQQSSAPDKV